MKQVNMRRENEENKVATETNFRPQEENEPIDESFKHPKKEENEEAQEDHIYNEENNSHHESEEDSKHSFDSSKASKVSKGISATLVTSAVVLVVASVVIVYKNFNKPDPTFEVTNLSFVNNNQEIGITYEVKTSKNDDNIPLTLEAVYLDSYSRVLDKQSLDISQVNTYQGTFSIAKYYDSNYIVKVVRTDHNSEKSLWESDTKFSRPKLTKFYSFYWDCHCTDPVSVVGEAAGKAYYQLKYLDDYDKWDKFKVNLVNKADTSITYTFDCEEPYNEKHLVDTLSKSGGEYDTKILATVKQDDGSSKQEVVYTTTVNI
jgi:hypothetical protein